VRSLVFSYPALDIHRSAVVVVLLFNDGKFGHDGSGAVRPGAIGNHARCFGFIHHLQYCHQNYTLNHLCAIASARV
jgi:hypothetical protein